MDFPHSLHFSPFFLTVPTISLTFPRMILFVKMVRKMAESRGWCDAKRKFITWRYTFLSADGNAPRWKLDFPRGSFETPCRHCRVNRFHLGALSSRRATIWKVAKNRGAHSAASFDVIGHLLYVGVMWPGCVIYRCASTLST